MSSQPKTQLVGLRSERICRSRRWLHGGVLVTLAVFGCRSNPSDEGSEPAPAQAEPTVAAQPREWIDASSTLEFGGCDAVYVGQRCALIKGQELRVWIPAASALEIQLGGQPVGDTGPVEVAGGQRISLIAPALEGELELRVREPGTTREWRLTLLPGSHAHKTNYDAAMALARSGDHEGAIAALREHMRGADADAKLHFASGISRIHLSQSNYEDALEQTRAVFEAATQQGRLDVASAAAARAAYVRTFLLPDYAEAARWIDQIPPDPSAMPTAHYHRGLLAYRVADLRTAYRELRAALDATRPLGLDVYRGPATEMLAQVAAQLGQAELAERYASAALADASPERSCQWASAWSNVGWARLLLAASGVDHEDPRPALEMAVSEFSKDTCRDPRRAASAQLNLAYAELIAGRYERAQARLGELDRGLLKPLEASWVPFLDAQVQLAQGQARSALRNLETARSLAQLGDDVELLWQVAAEEARAWTLLMDTERARASYEAADQMLESLVLRVSLDQGRELFLAGREHVAGDHVELLLSLGRTRQALCVARRTQARPYRMVHGNADTPSDMASKRLESLSKYRALRSELERARADDWSASPGQRAKLEAERQPMVDELHQLLDQAFSTTSVDLPGCSEGAAPLGLELNLHFQLFPIDAGEARWAAFLVDGGQVFAAVLTRGPDLEDSEWVAAVLAPFEAQLEARLSDPSEEPPRLSLELHADAWALPLEHAQIGGQLLLDGFEIVHGFGLSPVPSRRERTALIVADPRGDLHNAREEAREVERALTDAGWEVEVLSGGAVTAEALASALGRATLLHYAGHAESAGLGGWDSHLPIANDDRFDVHDILALPTVPGFVILSGCETGGPREREGGDSWNIAQAFLSAGSDTVIASTEVIGDHEARRMSAALYRNFDRDNGARTLRRAQRELRGESDTWAAFRTWIRPRTN